ncbi:hypothetical protein J2W32_005989 [Variovorax boronicumulans]|uniref:Uncharacterized protein n=1 Tax=Variovorax boronicumulans TaxID=436515 RepID=A0AAW8DAH2_9BURK|nr:hypothetical protein [Variovorax boronicumulans]MDQ0056915.1 hypothetical protein [Variovorax boronicumulans]
MEIHRFAETKFLSSHVFGLLSFGLKPILKEPQMS